MSFMRPTIEHNHWALIADNDNDDRWIPKEYVSDEPILEERTGYGARLSAPGYLDCTEYSVHATEREAWDALLEMYPEAFVWSWEPGHGYHMYCGTTVCADAVRAHFQSIDGCRIEQDGTFLYTVSDNEQPTDEEIAYEER